MGFPAKNQGDPMSRKSTAAPSTTGASDDPPSEANDHFDSLESGFFEQGQDGMLRPEEGELFDDQGFQGLRKWFAPSRQFFAGLAVGALLCGVLWWRVSLHFRAVAPELSAYQYPASVPTLIATGKPESLTATRPAELVGAAGDAAAPASAHQALVAVLALDAAAGDVGHEAEPGAVAAAPAVALAEPAVPAALPPSDDDVQRTCRKAMADKQKKQILSVCEAAFIANPHAADIAVLLAEIEFNRGRIAQASAWSKKAIAADPNVADAYVFVGEAEQNARHNKAAKDAYSHYLRLAPGGRYASDLRAVLRSL
jgi:tetratricopeptide (TPR) repeat protein